MVLPDLPIPEDSSTFLAALQAGSNAFMESLMTAHEAAVRQVISRRVSGDGDDHDDLVQCVWLLMYHRRMQFRGGSGDVRVAFRAWLVRLARTVCSRWRRARRPSIALDQLAALPVAGTPSEDALLETLHVDGLIRRLPRRQAEAARCRWILDLPEANIAQAMGCRIGTIKATLSKARLAIRRQLENGQVAPPPPA
jgi:RNA polymerase sigma-70 factor (ECF subfamily)